VIHWQFAIFFNRNGSEMKSNNLGATESGLTMTALNLRYRLLVAIFVFLALLFDGVELGLMPVASLSVSRSLLGNDFTPALGADWFAWLTASLMLGAAFGGMIFGHMGDRFGRVKALAASVLFYSLFAGFGGQVSGLNQLCVLRFMVGLGVGGVWPNGIALALECWPRASKPKLSGLLGSAINVGILSLSQVARLYPITPDSWRWLFHWCAAPAILGMLIALLLPESPAWVAFKKNPIQTDVRKSRVQLSRRLLLIAIVIGTIPLVGAWAASKWMIPWADQVAGTSNPGYKAAAQGWWALGASLGGFLGAILAGKWGARPSYAIFGLASTVATSGLFLFTRPLEPIFLGCVFIQGLIATFFFGWLPLYLPAMFPVESRATGTGIAYNTGRFLTAVGVFGSTILVRQFGGNYAAVGAVAGSVYALAIVAARFIPLPSEADDF
jgi:MFS family permease